jgi:serine/threonine/tyrosine-interacting protein
MQVCQAQRFCVNFDDTIKNILRSYWDILQAARSVSSSNAQQFEENSSIPSFSRQNESRLQPPETARSKRSIEDTRDADDIEMEDSHDPSDALRFHGRDNTPFKSS